MSRDGHSGDPSALSREAGEGRGAGGSAHRLLLVALALALVVGGLLIATAPARWAHLALPVLADPSLPRPPATALGPPRACTRCVLARAPGRVTALLRGDDGALWVGTFDRGLLRAAPGEPLRPVEPLAGRERFVNALAGAGGAVWAATHGGLVRLSPDGRRLEGGAAGAFDALLADGDVLLAGGPGGLVRIGPGGVQAVPLAGHDGRPARVTALARSGSRLWVGTPSGVHAVAAEAGGAAAARWYPLVFGPGAASTDVVMALAAAPGGVLAGTDDGGVAHVAIDGAVRALRPDDPRAAEVNPGAAATDVEGAAAFGTQGGGLLVAEVGGGAPALARAGGTEGLAVSAVARAGAALWIGLASGEVLEVTCAAAGAQPNAARNDGGTWATLRAR